MQIHLLTGFLGGGKTTAVQHAAQYLANHKIRTGIITNDQGSKLVDGGFFKYLDIPNREVINGCFCCNYRELNATITSLAAIEGAEVIFAESVGSCTDIVATVLKPLLKFREDAQVTVSTFVDARLLLMMLRDDTMAFDASVRYIYFKQLEEACVIIINKVDLINDAQIAFLKETVEERYGNKVCLFQNSNDEADIKEWLNVLDNYETGPTIASLNIDYDVYAAGEAKLAWVDHAIEVFSVDGNAMQEAAFIIRDIFEAVKKKKYMFGHLKFLINNSIKISYTSPADQPILIDFQPSGSTNLLINMRVQTIPENITKLIAGVIAKTERQTGCKIATVSLSAFQPGYPIPEYRM